MVVNLENQGVFNENLRRSFEKLSADKSGVKYKKVNKMILNKKPKAGQDPGRIRIVSTASSSDTEPESNTSQGKPFNRESKTRGAVRRISSKQQFSSSSSTLSSVKNNKCDDEKQSDIKQMFELNNKDGIIYRMRKNNEALGKKLQHITTENINLKRENFNLKEKEYNLHMKNSFLEKELLTSNDREESFKVMVSRFSEIIQSQDSEIAELKEKLKSNGNNLKQNSIFKSPLFYPTPTLELELQSKLKETEIRLNEQQDVNHQLKKYLEIMLLKFCNTDHQGECFQ